jgi:hypothetical protein
LGVRASRRSHVAWPAAGSPRRRRCATSASHSRPPAVRAVPAQLCDAHLISVPAPSQAGAPDAAALPRSAGSDVAFGWQFVEVTTRCNPFVQHVDDLDHTFRGDAIVENVNQSPDPCTLRTASILDVEAADTTGAKFRPLPCKRPVGLSSDLSHRGGENGSVPLPPYGARPLSTCRKGYDSSEYHPWQRKIANRCAWWSDRVD